MSQNGKGDKQRPMQITHDEWKRRHAETFANKAREQEQKLAGEKTPEAKPS